MDGCWNPLVLGCQIDWEAWSALAALLASVLAIVFSRRSTAERVRQERAQARVIAGWLVGDLTVLSEALVQIRTSHNVYTAEGGGRFDLAFKTDSDCRVKLGNQLVSLQLTSMASVMDRLHVLPSSISGPLVELYNATRRFSAVGVALQVRGSYVDDWNNSDARELRELLARSDALANDLAKACAKIAEGAG